MVHFRIVIKDSLQQEQLDAILEELSPTQLKYVAVRPTCRSDAEAAKAIKITPSTVYHWDNKARVEEAVSLLCVDAIEDGKERLRALMGKAIDVLEQEVTQGVIGDGTRLRAALTILERGGLSEKKELDVTTGGKPIVALSNENHERSVAELLKALGDDEPSEQPEP